MIDRSIASALVLLVLGCGVPARPGVEGMGPDAVVDESTPFSRGERAAAGFRCTPGEHRACRIYWRDIVGGMHCTEAVQHCRPDGRSWLACGRPPEVAAAVASDDPEDGEVDELLEDDDEPLVR